MSVLIRLLTSRAAGPAGVGLAVLLALALLVNMAAGRAREQLLRRELAAAQAMAGTCRAELVEVGHALDRQARAVAELKVERDRRTRAAQAAIQSLDGERANARDSAAAILAATPDGDACRVADRLILESVGG